MYFSGEMNSWAAESMSMNDLGIDTWQVTIKSDGDDASSEFKFRNSKRCCVYSRFKYSF